MSAVADVYWKGLEEGRILYQRCGETGVAQNYPRPFCTNGSGEPVWAEACLSGTVGGTTVIYRAISEEFASMAPYRLVLLDMPEGFRIMAHAEMDLKVGDMVAIGFTAIGSRTFPYCKKA